MKSAAVIALCILGITIPACAQRGGGHGAAMAGGHGGFAGASHGSFSSRPAFGGTPARSFTAPRFSGSGFDGSRLAAPRFGPGRAAPSRFAGPSRFASGMPRGMAPRYRSTPAFTSTVRNTARPEYNRAATEAIETAGITGSVIGQPMDRDLGMVSTPVWAGTIPTSSTTPMTADTTTRPHIRQISMTRAPETAATTASSQIKGHMNRARIKLRTQAHPFPTACSRLSQFRPRRQPQRAANPSRWSSKTAAHPSRSTTTS